MKFVLPAYTTVIECPPPERVVVTKAAWPLARYLVPMTVVPSLNVTVPVGAIVPVAGVTTAVRVTDWA